MTFTLEMRVTNDETGSVDSTKIVFEDDEIFGDLGDGPGYLWAELYTLAEEVLEA